MHLRLDSIVGVLVFRVFQTPENPETRGPKTVRFRPPIRTFRPPDLGSKDHLEIVKLGTPMVTFFAKIEIGL